MANLPIIADSQALQLGYSKYQAFATGFKKKFVPKNTDGSIFDCTGIVGATILFAIPLPTLTDNNSSHALTVDSADATGVVLSTTIADANAIAGFMQSPSTTYTIVGNTSSDTMLISSGSLNLRVGP